MKNFIIKTCMNYIKKNTNFNETKLKEIEYGIISIYLTLSKFIVISIICFLLGIFKEMLIFTVFFNIIRLTAFGLHATKSWMCWISSTIIFILIPLFCIYLRLNIYFKIIIGLFCIMLMLKNAPADTKKRPIINKKRRKIYKFISTLLAIIFTICSIIIKNHFISNSLIFALILENCLISPTIYKLFKLPYNNYLTFLKEHPDFINS